MTLEQDITLLSQVELLANFDMEQLRLLAFGAQKRDLKAGDILYRENALTDCGYVLVYGSIDLVRIDDGNQTIVETHGPGALIGELALITETKRATTAIATEDTQALRISRTIFRRVLEEFPELAVELHAKISKNVSDFVAKLDPVEKRISSGEL